MDLSNTGAFLGTEGKLYSEFQGVCVYMGTGHYSGRRYSGGSTAGYGTAGDGKAAKLTGGWTLQRENHKIILFC